MMEDPRLTRGTVQDTLILPSSVNGEAVTVGAGASVVIKHIHLVILALNSVVSKHTVVGGGSITSITVPSNSQFSVSCYSDEVVFSIA